LRYASLVALADEDSDPATFTAGSTAPTMISGLAKQASFGRRGKAVSFFDIGLAALLFEPRKRG
jgi:hypothetical protein